MGRGLHLPYKFILLDKRGNSMDIKKLFIGFMTVLCIGVIIFSAVTVVKRQVAPQEDTVISQDVMENDEILVDTDMNDAEASTEGEVSVDNDDDIESLEIKTMYTQSKVNVRSGPGTNHTRIIELQAGVEIKAVGELDANGWQMIDYEGTEAYILGRYLGDEMPVITPPEPTPEVTPEGGAQTPTPEQTPEQAPATPEGEVTPAA